MTAGDFLPDDNQPGYDDFAPVYPTAFGVELTPRIQGLLIALLGLVGAIAFYHYLVRPVQAEKQDLERQISDKEAQLREQEASLRKIEEVEAELERVIQQRTAIYSLFGDKESLDTLLLDLNQQIKNSNASITSAVGSDGRLSNAQLASLGYTPDQVERINLATADDPSSQTLLYTSRLRQYSPQAVEVIQDGFFGPELDGKLQRYTVDISMQALFPQTLAILRNMERLEPVVIMREFSQQQETPDGFNEDDLAGVTPLLQSDFSLQVLVPVNDPKDLPDVQPEVSEEGGEETDANAE